MKDRPRLRVHPHPDGPWFVMLGARRLAVSADLGLRLCDLDAHCPDEADLARCLGGDRAVARHLLATATPRRRRGGPWLCIALGSASGVRRIARTLVPLAGGWALAALACGGLALGACARPPAAVAAEAGVRIAALVLLIVSGLLHELGHAAALLRAGYPPGRLGVGLLAIMPVLWCDVSAVALLPRRERVRVDLAGPVVQLAAAGLFALLGRLVPGPPGAAASLAAVGAGLAAAWSVTPFFRADGFWVASDLVGRGPLDRLPRPGDETRTRVWLAAYRLARAGFTVSCMPALLRHCDAAGRAGPLLRLAGLLVVGVVAFGLVRFACAALRPRHDQIP